jgi:glycosyltransferase involved in cell wall biosynthesis
MVGLMNNPPIAALVISHMYPCRDLSLHGIFMIRQAQYLRHYGVECFFLVPRPKAPWLMYKLPRWQFYRPENSLLDHGFVKDETRYVRLPGMSFRLWEEDSIYWSLKKRAFLCHQRKKFAIVLGVSMLPDAGVSVKLGRDLKIPSVGLAVGSDVKVYPSHNLFIKKKLSRTIAALDMIIGVSNNICNNIKLIGTPKREPATVYLGRDVSLFQPADDKNDYRKQFDIPSDAVVGIYVGNIAENKGMRELASVIPALAKKYPEFYLILVGNGPCLGVFQSLRTQYPRIILPGNVSPETVAPYLKCSDFMIFPSYSECMPQSVLEAMNCGLCVIASRVGGIPEAVIHDETGLLVEPGNSQQLQDAIEQLLSNYSLRQRMSIRALSHSREKFDPHKNAGYFSELLYSAVYTFKDVTQGSFN